MQKLTTKEKLVSFSCLALISASITFVDWWKRGKGGTPEALLAGIIAIVLLFWLPLTLAGYLLGKIGQQSVWRELPLWVLSFYVGYRLWAVALEQIYPSFQFSALELFFICLPWSLGTYIIYRAYDAYKSLQAERLLRKQAELNQLRQTLQPHFLFNSLNTLSAFIASDPVKAEQLTQDLAAVLRQVLDTDKANAISLKHELLVLQKWLNIEQARLGDDLKVSFAIDEAALDATVPPFILQPLLENAIKHSTQRPVVIVVSCRLQGDMLCLKISDQGPGFPDAVLQAQQAIHHVPGVGLSTTLQRIALLSGSQFRLSNGPAPYGAVVDIRLANKRERDDA